MVFLKYSPNRYAVRGFLSSSLTKVVTDQAISKVFFCSIPTFSVVLFAGLLIIRIFVTN